MTISKSDVFFPVVLENFLSEHHCKLLTRWMLREAIHTRRPKGDSQVSKCISFPQPIFQEGLLHQYGSNLSSTLNLQLSPSYVYARLYLYGAFLPKHTDRKECELTVSICLDSSTKRSWPLYIEICPGKILEVLLATNSAVVFDGRRFSHWRNQLEQDWNSQLFLHYYIK